MLLHNKFTEEKTTADCFSRTPLSIVFARMIVGNAQQRDMKTLPLKLYQKLFPE